ncbi:MAG: putative GNAT family N-acyltransferase [Francisellaceae bacterium]|jgi:predicted GNAT family N-acyltransferase
MSFKFELLSTQRLSGYRFDCGIEILNRYLFYQAKQDVKRKVAAVYILKDIDQKSIVGFYTLSSTNLRLTELPDQFIKKLPKYPLVPATLIGRLAIDLKYNGGGFGRVLMIDAIKKSVSTSLSIGSAAIVVEAKNDEAQNLYKKFGFFILNESKLCLPMATAILLLQA